jgi:hypothetical protein
MLLGVSRVCDDADADGYIMTISSWAIWAPSKRQQTSAVRTYYYGGHAPIVLRTLRIGSRAQLNRKTLDSESPRDVEAWRKVQILYSLTQNAPDIPTLIEMPCKVHVLVIRSYLPTAVGYNYSVQVPNCQRHNAGVNDSVICLRT